MGRGWWWKDIVALEIGVKSMVFVNFVFCHMKNYTILNAFNVYCGKWMYCSVIFVCVNSTRADSKEMTGWFLFWSEIRWWVVVKNYVIMPIFAHISYFLLFIQENQRQPHFLFIVSFLYFLIFFIFFSCHFFFFS